MTVTEYVYLMTGRTPEEDAKQKAFVPYYVVIEMLKGWGKHTARIAWDDRSRNLLEEDDPLTFDEYWNYDNETTKDSEPLSPE